MCFDVGSCTGSCDAVVMICCDVGKSSCVQCCKSSCYVVIASDVVTCS